MNKNILIVDDFKTNIIYLKSILEKEGYLIFSCSNAIEASKIIEEEKFNLILLDVVMPRKDGYAVCSDLRKKGVNLETPVIFITSMNDEESIIKGFEAGGQDFITRPFKNKELLARVNTHIELVDKRNELLELNKNLEHIVSERTKALDNALQNLTRSYMELEEAQKELESLDQAKEYFLRIISHEIRTPLNGILGFSDILAEFSKGEDFAEYLTLMQISVKRLEKFSLRALLITELNTGRYPVTLHQINLNKIIKESVSKLDSEMRKRKIYVEYSEADTIVNAEIKLVEDVFLIVLENALEHSADEGKIQIRGSEDRDNLTRISISIEGKGFPESYLNAGNSRFYKKNLINEKASIDLYLAELIMSAMQGKIHVYNAANNVACIDLFFNNKKNKPETITLV